MHGLPHNFQPDYRQNFLTSLELPSIGSRTSSRNKLSSNKGKTRQNNPTFSGPQHLSFPLLQNRSQSKSPLPQLRHKLQTKSCTMQTAKKEIYKKFSQWYVQYKRTEIVLVQT
jgi:hypothetical protein